jgi:hypothetical protein
MSPGNLRKLASEINALVGMEFEMIVPDLEVNEPSEEREREYDWDEDDYVGSYSYFRNEMIKFFTYDGMNSRGDVEDAADSIDYDYQDWVSDRFNDWLNDSDNQDEILDIVQDYMTQDEDESDEDFRERAKKEWDEQTEAADRAKDDLRDNYMAEDRWGDFLESNGLEKYTDISNRYDLDWPYFTDPGEYRDTDNPQLERLADQFSDMIGRGVTWAAEWHTAERKPGKYAIEPDGSLVPREDQDSGIEFISPALPVADMLDDLKKVKRWAELRDCYTGADCRTGLHINVSTSNYVRDKLDYVKLVLMMGDEYVLKQFDRLTNKYAESGLKNVMNKIKYRPESVITILDQMKEGLKDAATQSIHGTMTDKFTSANVKERWVEFRSPGGDWLGEMYDKIEPTISRFVVALDAASDPTKYRQEYLKRLHRILTKTEVEQVPGTKGGKTRVYGKPDKDKGIYLIAARYISGELTRAGALRALGKDIKAMGVLEYEIVNRTRNNAQVYKFTAFTDEEAAKLYDDWLTFQGYPINTDVYGWRRVSTNGQTRTYKIINRTTGEAVEIVSMSNEQDAVNYALNHYGHRFPFDVLPMTATSAPGSTVPGSTNDLARQRLAAQMPRQNDVDGNWEVYSIASGNTIWRFSANTTDDAIRAFNIWQDAIRNPSVAGEGFDLRRVQDTTQSTSDLPPGNARWLIIDRENNVVTSFINRDNRFDAERYLHQWVLNNPDMRDRGPFKVRQ